MKKSIKQRFSAHALAKTIKSEHSQIKQQHEVGCGDVRDRIKTGCSVIKSKEPQLKPTVMLTNVFSADCGSCTTDMWKEVLWTLRT